MKKNVSFATLFLYNLTLITIDETKIVNPSIAISQSLIHSLTHSLTHSPKFHTYVNMICVKNENCELHRKLCSDFLAALPVETPWMFTLFSPEQRKFTA